MRLPRVKYQLALAVTPLIASFICTPSTPVTAKSKASVENLELLRGAISEIHRGNFETGISQLEQAYERNPKNEQVIRYLSYAHNREGARLDRDPALGLQQFCIAVYLDKTNEKAPGNAKNMIRNLGLNPDSTDDRLELAKRALATRDYISAVVEYEAALALKDDAGIRSQLAEAAKLAPTRPAQIHATNAIAYMTFVQQLVKSQWKPPQGLPPQTLGIAFAIDATGEVSKLRLLTPSTNKGLNESMLTAVEKAAPFEPMPPSIQGSAEILFSFDYTVGGIRGEARPPHELQKLLEQSEESALQSDVERFTANQDKPKLAEALTRLGAYYDNLGRLKEAEEVLQKSLALQNSNDPQPTYPDTLNNLGDVYKKENRNDEAVALFKQSIDQCEKKPDLGLFKLSRAKSLYGRLLLDTGHTDEAKAILASAETTGHPRKTIEEYTNSIAANPDDAVNYFSRACLYYEKEDWKNARADLDKAISLNPRYAHAYSTRSMVDEALKDYDSALTDIDKAKQIDPTFTDVYRCSAVIHNHFKQYDAAIKDYDKAIELAPKTYENYIGRGFSNRAAKNYEAAIRDHNEAMKIQPAQFQVYLERGQDYLAAKQYKSALQDFETALRLKPSHAFTYRCVGIAYNNLKDYERALDAFNKCLTLEPNLHDVVFYRGYACGQLAHFDRAIEDFTRAIQENPNSVSSIGDRSWAYYCMQDYPHALEDAEQTIKVDPRNAFGYLNRGRANLRLEHYDRALEDLDKAIELQPNLLDGKAYFYRAKVYRHSGKTELADKDDARAKFLGLELSKFEE